MFYDKVIEQFDDILRRAEDNQGTVIINELDKKAIEEARMAIRSVAGFPKDFLKK